MTTVLNFRNVILKLKSPMIDNLSFTQNITHFNVVNTIYDEIIEDTEFSDEKIRMYNNIISNKLDNDHIDKINSDVHTNNLISNKRKSLKRKCSDDANNEKNNVNTKKINPMSRKSRKILKKTSLSENNIINKNNKTSDDVTPEKKYDDSALLRKTSLSENNNINKNNKTSDDVTPEKEYDDNIKKVFAESMSGELLVVI